MAAIFKSESSLNMATDTRFAEWLSCDRKGRELFTKYRKEQIEPLFYMYIWAPYQKILAKTYHELIKNNNIYVGFVERALVKIDVNVTWQIMARFFSKYRKENRCVKIHELRFLPSKLSSKAAHNVIHYVFHAIKIKRRQIIMFCAHTMTQNTSTTSSYNTGLGNLSSLQLASHNRLT